MSRRTIFIIIIILIVAAIIFGLYYFLGTPSITPTPGSQNGGQTSGLPSLAPAQNSFKQIAQFTPSGATGTSTAGVPLSDRFGVVSQAPASSYFADPQDNVVIVQADGQIVQTHNGQATVLSSSLVRDLISSSFSYDGKKVLIVSGDRIKPQLNVFDVAARAWTTLSISIQNPVWSPAGYALAYLEKTTTGNDLRSLDLSAKTTPKPKTIATFHLQDIDIQWSAPQRIIIKERSSAAVKSSVWAFDMKASTLTPLDQEVAGLESTWDASGSYGALFAAGPIARGGTLRVVNAGHQLLAADFLTLPSKCVFIPAAGTSTQPATLLCATPRNQAAFTGATLPDAYNQKELYTDDRFILIDLATQTNSVPFNDPDVYVDATDLTVVNSRAFFINRYDNRVYGFLL